jgi:hypothetical protein
MTASYFRVTLSFHDRVRLPRSLAPTQKDLGQG